jgi:hypothetical protein
MSDNENITMLLLPFVAPRYISTFTVPIYLFPLINLTFSLGFTSLLLTGSIDPIVGLRNFYLFYLRYSSTSPDSLLSDGGSNARTAKIFTDPDDNELLKAADLYKDRISFSVPLWTATVALTIAALLMLINCLPVITVPAITRKVASAAASVGMLLLLGGIILQHVASAAMDVVAHLTFGTTEAHFGCGNIVFGWVGFVCSVLATVDLVSDVGALMAAERAQSEAEVAAAKEDNATRDRVDLTDARTFTDADASPRGVTRAGGGNCEQLTRKEFNVARSHVRLETQPIDAGPVPSGGGWGKERFTDADSAPGPPPATEQGKSDWKKDVAMTGASVAGDLAQKMLDVDQPSGGVYWKQAGVTLVLTLLLMNRGRR